MSLARQPMREGGGNEVIFMFAPFVYSVRLLAFAFIITGVIDKNRAR